jgi:tungstate transport system permease protein
MNEIISGSITAVHLILTRDPAVMEITLLTLQVTLTAVILATCIAIPLGSAISFKNFYGKKYLIGIIQTLYALPTVIIGLFCFLLLSKAGPLGFLGWLFTPTGMILGQTLLVIPIMIGLTISALQAIPKQITDIITGLGSTKRQFLLSHLREARFAIMAAIIVGFSRAISEVGAAIMIGGNIRGHTRILTTSISLNTSMGDIDMSLALGFILLGIAILVNIAMGLVQQR